MKSTSLSFYSLDYAIQGTHSDFLCNSSFHEIVICILSIKCNIFVIYCLLPLSHVNRQRNLRIFLPLLMSNVPVHIFINFSFLQKLKSVNGLHVQVLKYLYLSINVTENNVTWTLCYDVLLVCRVHYINLKKPDGSGHF